MTMEVLKGIRIVEGSAFIAAPMAGMNLAQLGADVIRFDPIGGGIDYKRVPLSKNTGNSLYWSGLNKGKRSIALDLRNPTGRELVQQLISQPGDEAGVLLTNFSGVKWLDYAALKEKRGDIIKIEISGNHDGTTALDYTVNSALGFPYITGPGTRENPVNHVLPAWDIACSLQAALGALAAIRYRQQSGKGQNIKLALSNVALAAVNSIGFTTEVEINNEERPSNGNYVHGAFGRDFGTKDGRRICVMAVSNKQWQVLCAACDLTEKMDELQRVLDMDFGRDVHRYEAREAIATFFKRWFDQHTLAEARDKLEGARACWGVYQSFRQLVEEDPRYSEENPMFHRVNQPGIGEHLLASSPLHFMEMGNEPATPAPLLGQHTDEILSEVLGLGSGAIGALYDQGIVSGIR